MSLTQTMFAIRPGETLDSLGRGGRSRTIQKAATSAQRRELAQGRVDLIEELQTEEVFAHWYDPDAAMELMGNAIMAANSRRIKEFEFTVLEHPERLTRTYVEQAEALAIKDLVSAWGLFFMTFRSLNVSPYAWRKLRLVFERAWGSCNGAKGASDEHNADWYRAANRVIYKLPMMITKGLNLGMQGWLGPGWNTNAEPQTVTQQHRLFPRADGTVFSWTNALATPEVRRANPGFATNAGRYAMGPWGPQGGAGPRTGANELIWRFWGEGVTTTVPDWFALLTISRGSGCCGDGDCYCFMPPWRWYYDLLFGPVRGLRVGVSDGAVVRTQSSRLFLDNDDIPGRDLSLAEYVARIGPNELVMEIYKDITANNQDARIRTIAENLPANFVTSQRVTEWRAEQDRIREELRAAQDAAQAAPTDGSADVLDTGLRLGETAADALRLMGVTCPTGQVKVNGRCQAPVPTCPAPYTRGPGDRCEPPASASVAPTAGRCPSGFRLAAPTEPAEIAGRCVGPTQSVACPDRFTLSADFRQCIPPTAPQFGSSAAQQIAARTLNVVSGLTDRVPALGMISQALPALVGIGEMLADIFKGNSRAFAAGTNQVDCFGRPLAAGVAADYLRNPSGNMPITRTTLERFRIIEVVRGATSQFLSLFTEDDEWMVNHVEAEWKACLQNILLTPVGREVFGSACAWLPANVPCKPQLGGGPRRQECPPGRRYVPGTSETDGLDYCLAPGELVSRQCVDPEAAPFGVQQDSTLRVTNIPPGVTVINEGRPVLIDNGAVAITGLPGSWVAFVAAGFPPVKYRIPAAPGRTVDFATMGYVCVEHMPAGMHMRIDGEEVSSVLDVEQTTCALVSAARHEGQLMAGDVALITASFNVFPGQLLPFVLPSVPTARAGMGLLWVTGLPAGCALIVDGTPRPAPGGEARVDLSSGPHTGRITGCDGSPLIPDTSFNVAVGQIIPLPLPPCPAGPAGQNCRCG